MSHFSRWVIPESKTLSGLFPEIQTKFPEIRKNRRESIEDGDGQRGR